MVQFDDPWVQFATRVAIGTLAGGLSDTVAVWLLFHPRERKFGIQGAIPKNRARLARSIGRTVGERLLTPEYLVEELNRSGLREGLQDRLDDATRTMLDEERGPLREILPPSVVAELEQVFDSLVPQVADRLAAYVETPEFEARLRTFVARIRAELADRPIGDVLTPERRTRLAARAVGWANDMSQSPELEATIREYISSRFTALLSSEAPVLERVPPPVVRAIEHAVDAYLPLAVQKLGAFLQQPSARDRIRQQLHSLFAKFVEDLRFHERVIARLVVTEKTFERVLDSMERDGVDQLASLLDDEVVRDEITRTINDAVHAYLQRPVSAIVGAPDSERAQDLARLASDSLLKALRADATRELLGRKLDEILERAEGRTWGDIIAGLDDATVVEWLATAARSGRARELAEDGVRAASRRLLDYPVGRIAKWVPPDATHRVAMTLTPAVWSWIELQVPALVQRMNLQDMVERKVNNFSVERVEELIRGVIQNELRMIILSGYILGGLISIAGFGLTKLFGG